MLGQCWIHIKIDVAKLTVNDFEKKLKRWSKKSPDAAFRGLKKGTKLILKDSKRKHMSGPRMPWGVGSLTNPTIDSKGRMRSMMKSVVKKRTGTKEVYANVRSTNGLSKILHDGGVVNRAKPFIFPIPGENRWARTNRIEYPKRPFLRVSVEKKKKDVLNLIRKEWKGDYKRSR